MQIPPYGVAIHEAIASGDRARMEQVANEAEEWLRQAEQVRAALAELRKAQSAGPERS